MDDSRVIKDKTRERGSREKDREEEAKAKERREESVCWERTLKPRTLKSGQWKGLKNFEERDLGCDKVGATTV